MLTFVLLFLGCGPQSVFEECVENRDAVCECTTNVDLQALCDAEPDSTVGAYCGIYDLGYCDTESSQFDSEMCERVHDELDAVEANDGEHVFSDPTLFEGCE